MYRRILIVVISVVLILMFSGGVVAKEVSIKPSDSTSNLQDPLILIYFTGGQKIEGFDEGFHKELRKTLPMLSIWGRGSLKTLYKEFLGRGGIQPLMDSNTIFLVHPKDIKYLEDLEADYPNLLPISCSKLKSYPFTLIYFSRDTQTYKIRGVIITNEINASLVKPLIEEVIPLDIPFRYENGQLQIFIIK